MRIGSTDLNDNTLANYTEALASWRKALTEDADLLLYGCNFAADGEGQHLANEIASLTGADVAASTDLTGSATLGGDWTLEYATGQIESRTAITSTTQDSWSGTLSITVDTTQSAKTDTTGATSLSFSLSTTSGSGTILIVEVASRYAGTASSVTYGGVALTPTRLQDRFGQCRDGRDLVPAQPNGRYRQCSSHVRLRSRIRGRSHCLSRRESGRPIWHSGHGLGFKLDSFGLGIIVKW